MVEASALTAILFPIAIAKRVVNIVPIAVTVVISYGGGILVLGILVAWLIDAIGYLEFDALWEILDPK